MRAALTLVTVLAAACHGQPPSTQARTDTGSAATATAPPTTVLVPTPDLSSCPPDERIPWSLPAPAADHASFTVDRRAGEYDQPATTTCVVQGLDVAAVPHGTPRAFAVPASTHALTRIDHGAGTHFYVSIPAGEALTLISSPCSSTKLAGAWLDQSEHSAEADPHAFCRTTAGWIRAGDPAPDCKEVAQTPSELLFLRSACTTAAADAVRRDCTDAELAAPGGPARDCAHDGHAGYCLPVTLEQAGDVTAEFYLGWGDHFAVCLDPAGQITSTLRLP